MPIFGKSRVADPDPHQSQNSGALQAQNGAVVAHNGGVSAQNGVLGDSVDQQSQIRIILMKSRIQICIKVKSWIRIRNTGSGSEFALK
jgi:hypothetical protein